MFESQQSRVYSTQKALMNKKRTLFISTIRKQKREKQFKHMRLMLDIGCELQPLINNLPTSIQKLDDYINDHPQNAEAISKQLSYWIFNHQINIEPSQIALKCWTNFISTIFENQQQANICELVLNKCFANFLKSSQIINNFEYLFISLIVIVKQRRSEWIPLEQIRSLVDLKWRINYNSFIGVNQITLYFYLAKNYPLILLEENFCQLIVLKATQQLCLSHYTQSLRTHIIGFLVMLTYADEKNRFIQVKIFLQKLMINNRIIDCFRFIIGFFEQEEVLIRILVLLHNFMMVMPVDQIWRNGIISQLVEKITNYHTYNYTLKIALRSTFLIFVSSINNEQGFNYLKEINGVDLIIKIANQYGNSNKQIVSQVQSALSHLFRRGDTVSELMNPYKLKLKYVQGSQSLKQIPQLLQFLQRENLI